MDLFNPNHVAKAYERENKLRFDGQFILFFSFIECGVSSSSEGLLAYLEGFCTIQSVDPRKIEKRIESLKMSFSKTTSLARERPMLFLHYRILNY